PSNDLMNKLAGSVLALYPYDINPDDTSEVNSLRQSMELIGRLPVMMVAAYQAKRRAYDYKSMYLHMPLDGLSTAENILSTLRADRKYTREEALLLDRCMILHAEHGGGNNSAFVCRAVTSSGTDIYSAISAAIGALKGPRHGGANLKVCAQLDELKANIKDVRDDDEITAYLKKILAKEAGDGSGLIYGMGHAVYTRSDPRAILLKREAKKLVASKGFEEDFILLDAIERLSPALLNEKKEFATGICANVDMYSGLVYSMLGIPRELFTPLFAVARMSGWCAHRLEEIQTSRRIMRPAYRPLSQKREYTKLADR
ncbi:MAG: citrate synthase, partial [Clostridia bacterium]|nr:citrate synthase [Clostridia bacterium]